MSENISDTVREITSAVKNFKRPMFPYGFSRNCDFCGGAPLSCCCRDIEKILKEFHEAAKRQGATEALEGLIASATTKHEQDGVTMTWATSTKNEMLRAAEDMLAALKADFSNPPQ